MHTKVRGCDLARAMTRKHSCAEIYIAKSSQRQNCLWSIQSVLTLCLWLTLDYALLGLRRICTTVETHSLWLFGRSTPKASKASDDLGCDLVPQTSLAIV